MAIGCWARKSEELNFIERKRGRLTQLSAMTWPVICNLLWNAFIFLHTHHAMIVTEVEEVATDRKCELISRHENSSN